MISYRFLSPAEEEVAEAALFYETTASARLGTDFLDHVAKSYPQIAQISSSGESIALDLGRCCIVFHLA